MKAASTEKGEIFYRAMGEIDPSILEEVCEMEQAVEFKKRKINIFVLVACLIMLIGANSARDHYFAGGTKFSWKNSEKTKSSASFRDLTDEMYDEREDGLYYIFENDGFDITQYCSGTEYFLAVNLNDGGTGYIVAMGGEKGARGYFISYYDKGEMLLGHGYDEVYGFANSHMYRADNIVGDLSEVVWYQHCAYFMGIDIPNEWFGDDLPEKLANEIGLAQKICGNYYHVQRG